MIRTHHLVGRKDFPAIGASALLLVQVIFDDLRREDFPTAR